MSQISNIVIKDGATTPADHTFAPSVPQFGDSPAEWRERNVSARLGDKVITLRTSVNANGTGKVKGMIALPETGTVDGKTVVLGINRFNFDFSLYEGSTIQGAKDIMAFAKNLLATTVVKDAVENGEVVY